jgi:hypothetical protein
MKKIKFWEQPGFKCCSSCGKRYYRSNKIRLWVMQNPGHRLGWAKEEQAICCACIKGKMAKEILHDLNPQWMTKAK